MPAYHPMAELAPRDVVSRAIFQELQKTGSTYVYLDISHKDPEYVKNRFPTIYKTCLRYGIDITKDRIPVAPAAHYSMGGIKTDEWGRTGIEGFMPAVKRHATEFTVPTAWQAIHSWKVLFSEEGSPLN